MSISSPQFSRFRLFLLCCITIIICFINTEQTLAADIKPCIPSTEAVINNLIPGLDSQAIPRNPKPLKTTFRQGEDDGGGYTETLLLYDSYKISIVRDVIDSINTNVRSVVWTKGIKVGDTRAKIESLIGYAIVSASNDEAQYLVCSDIGDVYAILRFSSDKLTYIEISLERP